MSIAEESKLLESQAARPAAKQAPDQPLREEDLARKEKEWEIERQFLEALFVAARKDESGLTNDADSLYQVYLRAMNEGGNYEHLTVS